MQKNTKDPFSFGNEAAQGISLKKLRANEFVNFKNTTVTCLGQGQIFGEIDVVHKRKYSYTLRCSKNDSKLYLVSAKAFHDILQNQIVRVRRNANEADCKLLKQLTAVVFAKW